MYSKWSEYLPFPSGEILASAAKNKKTYGCVVSKIISDSENSTTCSKEQRIKCTEMVRVAAITTK